MTQSLNKLNLLHNDFIQQLRKNHNHDIIERLTFLMVVVEEGMLNRIVFGYNQLKAAFDLFQEEYRTEINYTYLMGHYINLHMKEKLKSSYVDKLVFILELCSSDPKHPFVHNSFDCTINNLKDLMSKIESKDLENKLVITSMLEQLIETISIDSSMLDKLVEK